MKEGGFSQAQKIAPTNKEKLTTPNARTKEIPKPETINASGHIFSIKENIPYNKIPNTTFHYYSEIGAEKSPLNVTIIEIGLNNPTRKNEPIPLRIDHG